MGKICINFKRVLDDTVLFSIGAATVPQRGDLIEREGQLFDVADSSRRWMMNTCYPNSTYIKHVDVYLRHIGAIEAAEKEGDDGI